MKSCKNEEENIKWQKRKCCDWRQTSLCAVYLCSWTKCWPIAHIHHWLCLLFSSCVLAECMSHFAFLQSDIWGWVSVYKISWCLNNPIKLDGGGVWSAHADCILFITRSGKRTGGASKGEEMQNEGHHNSRKDEEEVSIRKRAYSSNAAIVVQ